MVCSCDPSSLGGRSRKVKFETSLEFLAWKETDRDRDRDRDKERDREKETERQRHTQRKG